MKGSKLMTKKILVVDDDRNIGQILHASLSAKGYETIISRNGEDALSQFMTVEPDLVLLDVMMGQVDEGFQVAYELKGDPETKDIPILMLTAVADQTVFDFDPKKDQEFLPVNEFLEKPISPRKLVDMVRKHLPTTI